MGALANNPYLPTNACISRAIRNIMLSHLKKFVVYLWKGMTHDDKDKFSTKRAAYIGSVFVTSWVVIHLGEKVDWSILTAYALHCTGPTALREWLATKTGPNTPKE